MRNYKNTLKILGIYLIGIGLTLAFLPWWGLGVMAALGAFLFIKPLWQEIILGVLLGAIIWGGNAYYISMQNNHILTQRFIEGKILPMNPILLTMIFGAMHSLLGCLFGHYLGKLGNHRFLAIFFAHKS